jgi:hypothetical protein
MNFTLTTNQCGLYGVFGEMKSEDGKFIFATLEHAYPCDSGWAPKVERGKTYECVRYDSPDHGYPVFVLKSVPDFQGQPVTYIEIHIGNYNKDSKGCILLGLKKGTGMIEDSGEAFKQFMELQKDVNSFTLTVV